MALEAVNDCEITQDLVQAEMERYGLSQTQVARESDMAASRLNQWLSGKYRGDNEAVAVDMRRWLNARSERTTAAGRLPEAPAWIATETAKRILSALAYAQMAGDVSVVYGGAGVGKTCTARQYARENPNVWIATMTPSVASVATSLERIAHALGIRETPQGAARIEAAIIDRLQGTSGLLVVDEAQHLSKLALEGVRGLHDATGVGLALLGNDQVYSQLTGGARQAHFAQLFSRIGNRMRLSAPTDADVTILAEAWGIAANAKTVCRKIAGQPGALRGLTKALRMATMAAAGEGAALAREHIKFAWESLGGSL